MQQKNSHLVRLQAFAAQKPTSFWFAFVGAQIGLGALLFLVIPSARNPAALGFLILYSIGAPTMNLVRRFSSDEHAVNPVSRQQENAVGRVALSASVCSIVALLSVIFGKRLGIIIPESTKTALLFAYAVSLIIALTFGVAGQRTKYGLIGFWIAAVWFGLLIILGLVLSAIRQTA